MKKFLRTLLFIPPVLAGVAIAWYMISSSEPPTQKPRSETVNRVKTMTVRTYDFTPECGGYGEVQPRRTWKLIPRISGEILYVNPNLKKGAFIEKGSLLVRIDKVELELRKSELETSLQSLEIQLDELDQQEKNQRETLQLELRTLDLLEREVERQKELLEQGTVSATQFERAQREYLQHKSRVKSIENSLALLPDKRRLLQSQKQSTQTRIEQADLDISYAEIKAPFDVRVASENVEQTQYAQRGAVLAQFDGTYIVDVYAQFTIEDLKCLVGPRTEEIFCVKFFDPERLRREFQLDAKVQLETNGTIYTWDGKFSRANDIVDPQTRTIGVVATVEGACGSESEGPKMPLVKGMFCKVLLTSKIRPKTVLVPRSAIHEGIAYVVEDGRLAKREVEVSAYQKELAIVEKGLDEGDTLVLSQLVPAIEGMKLEAQEDTKTVEMVARTVSGESQ